MARIRLFNLLRGLFHSPAAPSPARFGELAEILCLPEAELSEIRLGRRYHYRAFTLAKRDGRERRILAPSPELKALQSRLLKNHLRMLPIHPAATAFTPGASIAENARRHAGRELIVMVDLADFFESTPAARVREFFLAEGWEGPALSVLMRLCTYRNSLPQGAPTSPCLSNLVNSRLDQELFLLAQRRQAVYSRYGDDLTFSWNTPEIPTGFQEAVTERLLAAGYRIQPLKGWRCRRLSQAPEISGVVLTPSGRLRVPARIRQAIRSLRWQLWWHPTPKIRKQLQGYEAFLHAIDRE